jgi:agmatine/peptidylarginine deiminase
MKHEIIFPAEWHPQSAVQLTWPHKTTSWATFFEVSACFENIAVEIAKRERLIIVCSDKKYVSERLAMGVNLDRIIFRKIPTDDYWARDHAAISTFENGCPVINDFIFNGWGMKYPAGLDDLVTRRLFESSPAVFAPKVKLVRRRFVLEGGSIDTDGQGSLLTTASCLLSKNRNSILSKVQIEKYLRSSLGVDRFLWLEHGHIAGDDTDGHVDTLARFCSEDAIAYVQCTDPTDPHFEDLRLMEDELKSFRRRNGLPYRLLPLPLPENVTFKGESQPATYANFLIINGAVLLPFYDVPEDEMAAEVLREAFPDREIKGVYCRPLLKQYGSLHCVTMQFPIGFI